MASINLKNCDGLCSSCIKDYIEKHKLKPGDKFLIPCKGIPQQYIPDDVMTSLGGDAKTITAMLDPITWASEFLDWHCFDPDGEIWKRKTRDGTLGGILAFDPTEHEERIKKGKSAFHRPYQASMLRCTSRYKVFRIGRQAGKSECLCVLIAWSMFTHENFSVEVITPYQSQIDLIFGRLTEMIKSNSTLANSVERNVKAPNYQIKLKNGSRATGFTAGTRSGQEAGAARGQHANLLIFDEADYLSPKDIDSALAMIINHPDATVWMSSTPTGRRERFFENCQNKLYKEFHFTSHVNPNFSAADDEFYRSQYTEDGYQHEVMARFGEQEEGVYQLKYVEDAQSNFSYGDFSPSPGWVYMIGVDWNDVKIGTTIAVVGYNPQTSIFYLVDKAIVSKGERTQLSACQKIAELNRKWLPEYIYVDEGFGNVQIEVLHDYGQRALFEQGATSPDARLRLNVKGFDFGSSVEVHDPFTHQMIKKPSKPFLVENSVRRFETRGFKYPKSDEAYTAQLLGYIVKRVSVIGRPVYEAQNEKAGDHFLDAVNLALVAFALERSKFGKPTYSAMAAIAGRFGEKPDPERREEAKDKNQSIKKLAEQHRPKTGRGMMGKERESLLKDPNGSIPGANMASAQTKLWAWPGWGHDAPKPLVRTLTEAAKEAERRLFRSPHRRVRPSRSKF